MPHDLNATVGNIAKVKLSGDFGVSRHVHNKRIDIYNCMANGQDTRKDRLEVAITTAQIMIAEAHHVIRLVTQRSVQQRYWEWFGGYTQNLRNHAYSIINNMHTTRDGAEFMGLRFKCHTQAGPNRPPRLLR